MKEIRIPVDEQVFDQLCKLGVHTGSKVWIPLQETQPVLRFEKTSIFRKR